MPTATRPAADSGLDFSKIFTSLDYWFQADFSAGLRAEVHGTAATERGGNQSTRHRSRHRRTGPSERPRKSVGTAEGVGRDRRSTSRGRSVSLHADIAQDLIDKMVQMLNWYPPPLAKFCKPCGAAFPGCGRTFQRVPLCSNFLAVKRALDWCPKRWAASGGLDATLLDTDLIESFCAENEKDQKHVKIP